MATPNNVKFRKSIRQRLDATALHKTQELDATTTEESVKLDIVAKKITVQLSAGLTANVLVSVDGITFTSIAVAATGFVTYGDTIGDHLTKWVKIQRTAGSGKGLILGV